MLAQGRDPIELLLDPPGPAWPGLAAARDRDSATRAALGLPTVGPILMGGHQPGFWHPGILAKWFALETLAARLGGRPAWVVVDQSPGAGARLPYPAKASEVLTRRALTLGNDQCPPAAEPPTRVEAPNDGANSGVAEGLSRAARLLAKHSTEPTLARQLHGACAEAVGEVTPGGGRIAPVFASELSRARAFAELVGRMRGDADACARLYNEAASAAPEAGVRPLARESSGVELPLWERVGSPEHPGPWRTVTSDRLADLPDDRLALRGLPMTGLLRAWVCDLFVHGTGGGGEHGYDRVTEQWFASWLGVRDLAPTVVASATMRLAWDAGGGADHPPTPREIARAIELAHRAAHDPSLLGEAELGTQKRALAGRMASLPRGSEERAALFRRMQELRSSAAAAHRPELAALRERAERLAARRDEAEIAADREWSFLFHPREALVQLRDRIRAEIG